VCLCAGVYACGGVRREKCCGGGRREQRAEKLRDACRPPVNKILGGVQAIWRGDGMVKWSSKTRPPRGKMSCRETPAQVPTSMQLTLEITPIVAPSCPHHWFPSKSKKSRCGFDMGFVRDATATREPSSKTPTCPLALLHLVPFHSPCINPHIQPILPLLPGCSTLPSLLFFSILLGQSGSFGLWSCSFFFFIVFFS
jgi:hypothetical protein